MIFSCDFETTTDPDDCRVWGYGIHAVGKDDFICGNSLDNFMKWCRLQPKATLYFHNLKFDGEFIIHWLLSHKFQHEKDKRNNGPNTFNTLISDKGMFYSIEIIWDNEIKPGTNNRTKIYDSLKVLPFSVDKVAKAFDLPISKLKIDYDEYREPGHILTQQEVDYIKNDVAIIAKALPHLFEQKLNKMTQGSNALADYKKVIGKKHFEKWFPILDYEVDKQIRQSYKGGFTYLNPIFKEKDLDRGIVLDVNSLYPSVMYDCLLPYGEPVAFTGRYKKDTDYPLYTQMISCSFRIKKNHIPTIQIKNNLAFRPTEYLENSNGEEIVLTLCNPDLYLFLQHYDVFNLEWLGGWKYKASSGMFTKYIDKWYKIKEQATIEGNEPLRTLAKLMLNALYGKFGTNPNVRSKIPYLDENGLVKYKLGEKETRDPVYIPVATFVTSYARNKTISSAQKVYDRFVYADTDSLHLIGTDIPECLDVHQSRLGAWKHESTFEKARFLRQKTYIEQINEKIHITCAGMPDRCYDGVTWDNFHNGMSYTGKLRFVHVPGGIVLLDTPFTIK